MWGLSAVTLVPDNQARQGYLPNSSGAEQYVGVNAAVAPLLNLWPAQNGPELGSGIAEAFSHPPPAWAGMLRRGLSKDGGPRAADQRDSQESDCQVNGDVK